MCNEEICELRLDKFLHQLQSLVGKVNWMKREPTTMPGKLDALVLELQDMNKLFVQLKNSHPIPKFEEKK